MDNILRTSTINRKTEETSISIKLNLDGTGKYNIETDIGFLKHMLEQISKHSLIDLDIKAHGDTETGTHHTIEDTAIALGRAIRDAKNKLEPAILLNIVSFGFLIVGIANIVNVFTMQDITGMLSWFGWVIFSTLLGIAVIRSKS